jgi:hypothetical protein
VVYRKSSNQSQVDAKMEKGDLNYTLGFGFICERKRLEKREIKYVSIFGRIFPPKFSSIQGALFLAHLIPAVPVISFHYRDPSIDHTEEIKAGPFRLGCRLLLRCAEVFLLVVR